MKPLNPYFVHHSNQSGQVLILTKLNGTNYMSWFEAIMHAFTDKNKIRTSMDQSSHLEVENTGYFALWNQYNNMILS